MDRDPNNPLARLIREGMARKGMVRQTQLQMAILKQGTEVSLSAITVWLSGGGMKDEHRPVVCAVLGIDIGDLQRAASARAQRRLERRELAASA